MNEQHSRVSVVAPARLHMGFLDLSGYLGRHFGSIGVALNEINTKISLAPAEQFTVSGESVERAEKCLRQLCHSLDVPDTLHIHIENAIPEHIGLGSGTQLSLAIGMALNQYYKLGLNIREIASLADRGKRSGIGIGVFELGGLVVDGGRGDQTLTPPILSHMEIPESWRFILAFDERGQGLHGKQELQAFKELPEFPHQEAARLCYLLLMQALPAIAESDIEKFGEVIEQLQYSIGEYFAEVQGGVFTSPEVEESLLWLKELGAVGIGQTSWGPTGFCIVDGVDQAANLVNRVRLKFKDYDNLTFMIVRARNCGANIYFD